MDKHRCQGYGITSYNIKPSESLSLEDVDMHLEAGDNNVSGEAAAAGAAPHGPIVTRALASAKIRKT